jgi:hypothetical protein
MPDLVMGTAPAGYCESCDTLFVLSKLNGGLCAGCREHDELLDLRAEVKQLRQENGHLRAQLESTAPLTEAQRAEYAKDCPADHGSQCCGYPATCRAALDNQLAPKEGI